MLDPYLYENSNVLKNKLHITSQDELDKAEADYVTFRLKDIALNPLPGKYNYAHLMLMHEYIFQDLYEWAGRERVINMYKEEPVLGGLSIEYSDFRDIKKTGIAVLGNMTRTKWSELSKQDAANELSHHMALLWKIHPFREGNTRTVITFCCQYADSVGLVIDRSLFEDNSQYVRTALVAYNAVFGDDDFSKKEYLEKIVYEALYGNTKS